MKLFAALPAMASNMAARSTSLSHGEADGAYGRRGEHFQDRADCISTPPGSAGREREPSCGADPAQPVLAHGFGLIDQAFDIADGAMES